MTGPASRRGPDLAFADPRLASLYDALNAWSEADDHYLSLALAAPSVLDVGCGTGLLLATARSRGHPGVLAGADPSPAMLAVARERCPAGVEWLLGDAASVGPGRSFDLVTMTGHTFQVLLSDDETVAALANLARHLAPGGRLAFETRNPGARAWERWRPALTRRTVRAPGGEAWEVSFDVRSVEGDLVTFDAVFRSASEVLVSESTLRFPSLDDVARCLAAAGMTVVETYGDWSRSPVTPASPELVVVAT